MVVYAYILLHVGENEVLQFLTVLLRNVVFELAGVLDKTNSAKGTSIGVWLLPSYIHT